MPFIPFIGIDPGIPWPMAIYIKTHFKSVTESVQNLNQLILIADLLRLSIHQ